MRIALLNEGTYPVVTGGVSTWCHRLIGRLPEHEFHVVTVVGLERTNTWPVLDNLRSLTVIPMWDAPTGDRSFGKAARRQAARVQDALGRVWSAVLPAEGDGPDLGALRSALQDLVVPGPSSLAQLLDRSGSTRAVMDAWARHRRTRPHLPSLSAAVAADVARQADRMLAVMDAKWPEVDVVNATANGTASLLALVRYWQDGTPFVLSEHGVYLRERYLALGAADWPWLTRYALMAFTRGVCQLAYVDAAALAPVSEFNARWEVTLGADPSIITPIPNAIDPAEFPPVATEPERPTVAFLGRVDPLKDLHTLIGAFGHVHAAMPEAVLRIFGPTPKGNEEYLASLEKMIDDLGIRDVVTFEGPTDGPRPAIEAGHVVALSSISEGLPFSVIESMMSGRATVNTDVGGVAECTGRDGQCGVVIPARDPEAMAASLLWLLRDDVARQRIGRAARQRALDTFSIDVFESRYRALYASMAVGRLGGAAPETGPVGYRDISMASLFELMGVPA